MTSTSIMISAANCTGSGQLSEHLRETFVQVMVHEHKQGNFTDGAFNSPAWKRIEIDFADRNGQRYTKKQLQSQLGYLKKKFMVFKALVENSGFGWDDAQKIPTAFDRTWTEYLAKHPATAPYRFARLPLYEELTEAFEGRVAVGHFASAFTGKSNSLVSAALPTTQTDGGVSDVMLQVLLLWRATSPLHRLL